jgi:hypothetical protein
MAKSKIDWSWEHEGKTTGKAPAAGARRRAVFLRGLDVSGFWASLVGNEVQALWSGLAIRYIWVCQ